MRSFPFLSQEPSHRIHGPGKDGKKDKKPIIGKAFFIDNVNTQDEGYHGSCQPEYFHDSVISLHKDRLRMILSDEFKRNANINLLFLLQ